MWESLPPVAPSSATPADELAGVSVAVHTSGMISGSTVPTTPNTYAAASSTPISRGLSGTYTNTNNNNSGSSGCTLISRPPGTATAPSLPSTVVPAATPPNSNPFATPRDASLASIGAAGTRDLTARPNVVGASPAPPCFPPVTAAASSLQLPMLNDNNENCPGNTTGVTTTSASTAATATVTDAGWSASLVRDCLATPHNSTAALMPPAHLAALSPLSVPSTSHRPPPLPPPAPPLSSTGPALSASPVVHQAAPAAFFDVTRLHSAIAVSPLPGPPAKASSPTVSCAATRPSEKKTSSSGAAIAGSISPRDAQTHSDALSVQVASAMSASASNAPWQSPGSISIGSARFTNDPMPLYFSSGMPEYGSEGLPTAGNGASSGLRMRSSVASQAVPPVRRYQNNSTSMLSAASGGGVTPAGRLDITSLQLDTNTSAPAPALGQQLARPPAGSGALTHHTDAGLLAVAAAANTRAADATAAGALATPTSFYAVHSSLRPPPPPPPAMPATSAAGSATETSVPLPTFVPPHFQPAGAAFDESLVSNFSTAAAGSVGLTTAGQSLNANTSGAAGSPLLARIPQPLPPAPQPTGPGVATSTGNISRPGASPGPTDTTLSCASPGSLAGRASAVERGGADVVRVVGTSEASLAGVGPVARRERLADVRHRYTVPPGLSSGAVLAGATPPTTTLAPSVATAGQARPLSLSPPRTAAAATGYPPQPFTPSRDAEGGLTGSQHQRPVQHHVIVASNAVSPLLPTYSVLIQHPTGLSMSATQAGGNNHTLHNGNGGLAAGVGEGFAEPLHGSLAAGSLDHNQSFYLGTTGSDNLRRSFFFPHSALPLMAELRDDGGEWNAGDDVGQGPSLDVASYLWQANNYLAQCASTAEQQQTAAAVAAPVGGTSAVPAEATEGGDRYCSPVLYHPPSFTAMSPAQTPIVQPHPPTPLHSVPSQALAPQHGGNAPLPPASSAGKAAVQLQQRSLPEESLRASLGAGLGGRPNLTAVAADASTSLSSPYPRPSLQANSGAGSNNLSVAYCSNNSTAPSPVPAAAAVAESARYSAAANANQSFTSPTLANLVLRYHFEDSVANASEVSLTLLESSAAATHANNAKAPSCATSAAPAVTHSASNLSSTRTPQKAGATATAATATVATDSTTTSTGVPAMKPALAYLQDWERSLTAFQNRAESYYTFKNLCTETYLTLIEHDVDRFLVCYYSGGTVKPEEAVQEALASRAGTPAAISTSVLSSTSGGSSVGRGRGLQKIIQTNKTLQRLSDVGSKWLTNLRRTAMAPVPVWGDAKSPSSSIGTATPMRGGRSVTSSVAGAPADVLASIRVPQPLPLFGSVTAGDAAAPSVDGADEWWKTTDTTSTNESAEPIYFASGRHTEGCGSSSGGGHSIPQGPHQTETTLTGVGKLLLGPPLSSSSRSFTTTSTLPDIPSTTSLSVVPDTSALAGETVSTPRRAPLSRLSSNIAAEEELQCLRQLGSYMANVIPDTYMDVRPSEQVLLHVRRNYPIILNALQHVLLMSGNDATDTPTHNTSRHGSAVGGMPGSAVTEAAKQLIASRIRQGLLVPSVQATWRDYLTPLEMKVKELVEVATTNIDPILKELQAVSTEGGATAAEADQEAHQRLRAQREQPVRRLARLLRGDEEYLATIHRMDDEFIEDGEAWRERCAAMRGGGVALSDYVPVYGLVLSRLHRLEIEHRTVLELWCGGVKSAFAGS